MLRRWMCGRNSRAGLMDHGCGWWLRRMPVASCVGVAASPGASASYPGSSDMRRRLLQSLAEGRDPGDRPILHETTSQEHHRLTVARHGRVLLMASDHPSPRSGQDRFIT